MLVVEGRVSKRDGFKMAYRHDGRQEPAATDVDWVDW